MEGREFYVSSLGPFQKASFPERFRMLRREYGWSQSYVAEQINVDNTTINRWEHGKALPASSVRQKICELFGVDAEALGLMQKEAEDDNAASGKKGMPNVRLKRQRERLGWSQVQVAEESALILSI
jgi:transcriptional regulator with XRE-family HTH domain